MFAEIKDNALIKFPYTFANLNEDNPYTNFKSTDLLTAYQGTNANVSGNTLINVVIEDQPTFDLSSEICTKNTQPTLINNVWTLGWTVTQMTADQITQTNQTEALNIRSLRNSKLTACDWTQSPDNPMASATKTAWATYRQALRDLTKETGFPWNVTWPTDPNGNI